MGLSLFWTCFCLSLWTWSPAEAIAGGRPVSNGNAPGSIGRLEVDGKYHGPATYVEALLHGHSVALAISATERIFNATEKLRFVGNVVDRIDNKGGYISDVKKVIYYKDFNISFPRRNNIIACVLKQRIRKFRNICILANSTLPVNTKVLVAGWGATLTSAPNAQLRRMNIAESITTNSNECAAISRHQGFAARVQMSNFGCVRNERAGPCQNDEGAPIFEQIALTPCRIGGVITSGGVCGCNPTRWSVYLPGNVIESWLNSLGYWGTDRLDHKIKSPKPRKPNYTFDYPYEYGQ